MNPNSETPYSARQNRLLSLLTSSGLDALALNPGPSLTYLTGLHFHLMERPVVTLFTPHASPIVVLPQLETAKTSALPYEVQIFPYGEDPQEWQAVFQAAVQAAGVSRQRIGVEPGRLRVLELRYLEGAASLAQFISAEDSLAALRMSKDASEIQAMRKAADIAERALQAAIRLAKVGMTERELASELTLQLLRAGSDPELPFSPIVSAGPNSANPHATPTARPLQPGDLLVIDWGAYADGYCSDITRTFAVAEVEPEMEHIVEVVREANAAARAAARPGIPAEAVDHAARQVIDQAGLGAFFTHRTGHGLGMEPHEPPYIRAGNPMRLEPGMTFTIEPGVYLPDRNGSRIEDDVVITDQGAESLTSLPRELAVIG